MLICKILRAVSAATGIIAGLEIIYFGVIIADQAHQVMGFNDEMAFKVGLLSLFVLIAGANLVGWSVWWLVCALKKCGTKTCCHDHNHSETKASS
ncbi:MAG: hypothetical protein ORN98_03205 [Alphaproteobacteria bacterium]|nr:hypothetical protein [Alphaproteobacteria bacterium]